MFEQPASEPYLDGDYEYDEAHAAAGIIGSGAGAEERPHPSRWPAQAPGSDGDYSYDLAHDIPPGAAG